MAKASDNVFPYLHVAPAAAPASPSAGSQRLYLDSADGNKLKRKDSAGTVVTIEGGGGSLTVQDENSNVSTSVTQIDFQGSGVTTTSGTGEVIVTIPGGSTPGAWTAWTPALTAATTNPTLGSGSVQEGSYMQLGKLVIAHFNIQFGSSGQNAGSGEYRISLPVAAVTTGSTVPMGVAASFTPNTAGTSLVRQSATTVRLWLAAGSYFGSGSGIGAGSQIWGVLTYEAA